MVVKTAQEIASEIEKEVRDRSLTISQLLADCGLSGRVISNMKTGSMPSADKLYLIAEQLDMDLTYLLKGKEPQEGSVHVAGAIGDGSIVQGINNGLVTLRKVEQHTLSDEATELLRIFESLDVKKRMKLLETAFVLEDE